MTPRYGFGYSTWLLRIICFISDRIEILILFLPTILAVLCIKFFLTIPKYLRENAPSTFVKVIVPGHGKCKQMFAKDSY